MIDYTDTEVEEDEHICDREGWCGCAEAEQDAYDDYWD